MLNPSRLTLARKRRKLTGRELANLAGISPEHLSRIEKEKVEPEKIEPGTIDALAQQLRYPVGFFHDDAEIDVPTKETASFRGLSSMSAKERESALAAGGLASLLSDWVDKRFDLPKPDLPDLRFEKCAVSAARALRSIWGLGERPVSNVIRLLESKGVRVFSLSEDTRNVDAFSCWRNDTPYVFLNTFKTPERSRFDAIHELGHLVLHRHGKPQGREAETEADNFASNFLIPDLDLIAHLPFATSLNQLVKAKKRWGVSVAALAYRLHKKGILTDWHYRTFCIHINKRFGQTEPDSMERERSVVWDKIFRELWLDRKTRDDFAKEVNLPLDEFDALVFNLTNSNIPTTESALKNNSVLRMI